MLRQEGHAHPLDWTEGPEGPMDWVATDDVGGLALVELDTGTIALAGVLNTVVRSALKVSSLFWEAAESYPRLALSYRYLQLLSRFANCGSGYMPDTKATLYV